MCLAIPGQIETIFEQDGLPMAKVNFGGIRRPVCLQYVPDVIAGNYVLVHVGVAIGIIDEVEAQRTYLLLQERGELSELTAETGL
jgi:hydrogenase expression/formation protein HypC